jgi:PAS domain S-box-containing protein
MYQRFLPYGVAIGLTALALLLTLCVEPFLLRTIGAFFYITIIVSAWYGGFRPGSVAVVLSTLAINYFFIPPRYQLWTERPENVFQLAMFLLVAFTINLLTSNFQDSKQKIERLSQKLATENAEQLRMALSAAQMGMWNWEIATGEINWSPEHDQLFGLTPGTFDGKSETFNACLHPDDRETVNQAVQQALQTMSSYHCEFRVVWADGSIHWIEGRGQAFYDEAGQPVRMTGTVMAIDERKQAQGLLEQQFEQQRLVMEVTQRIRRSLNLQDILQTTVDEVRQFLECDRVTIFQFSPGWGGAVVVESVADEWMPILPLQIYDPCIGEEYVESFKQGLVTAKADIYTAGISPCHVEFLAQFQVRANLVVPIMKGDELWGLLAAHHCAAPRQWQSSEIDLLRQLAAQVSVALQQSALFEQVQTELTERKQAEIALRESEAKFQLLAETVEEVFLIQSADYSQTLYISPGYERIWEHSCDSLYQNPAAWIESVYPEDRDNLFAQMQRVMSGEICRTEYRIIKPSGELRWIGVQAFPVFDEAGQIYRLIASAHDITERKQAEAALRQSEERFRHMADNAPVMIWVTDATGYCTYLSKSWYNFTGQTEATGLGFGWLDVVHPEDFGFSRDAFLKATEQHETFQLEYRLRRQDGEYRWAIDAASPWFGADGQFQGFIGSVLDISDRKLAEQTLAKELLRIQTLFNTSFDGIVILDFQGNVIDANPRFAEMIGYTLEETARLNLADWDAQFTYEELQQLLHDYISLKSGVLETRHRRKDGSIYDVEISSSVVEWEGEILRFSACRDISDRKRGEAERKQAEVALRQSEERYRTLFESIDEGFCVLEMLFDENDTPLDYRFLEINPQFEKQTGLEQAVGKTARQLLPNLEDHWFEIYGKVALTGEPLRFENGSEVMNRWFDVYALRVGQPSSRKVALVFKDITERKRAEIALVQLNAELEQRVADRTAQLREVNDRLLETVIEQQHTQLILLEQAQLLDLAHDTILTRDLNGVITFWNEGAEQMYDWTKAEALGQQIHTFLQTHFPKPLAEIQSELLERGYWEGELIHTRRDGSTITVASRWVMQKDEMGRPIKVLEINNDITLQKQAEVALSESEERRRLALDLTHIGFWDLHLPSGNIIWNDNHFTLLGLDPYDIEPSYKLWRSHIHPDDIDWVEQRFLESIENHTDYTAEYRVVHRDGSVHWFMARARATYDDSGQPLRSLGVLLDISDRKRIQQALQQSEEKFRQLAENIQAVFWMIDAQTQQVLYLSNAYETIWLMSSESVFQNHSNWLEAIHPDDRPHLETVFFELKRTGQYDEQYRIIRPDGSIRWIRDRAFPIKNEAGELVRVAGIAEDITEQQKIEQMKSEFIGIVSHELRTPLTAIKMSLGLLKTGIYDKKPDKFQRMLDIALIDTNRLVNLVNDILDLERLDSGRAILEKTPCQAADLMQQAVNGVEALATPQHITLTIAPTDAKVWAAADAIIQTLTNLLSNAIKFSPPNSTITLSAECQTDVVLFRVSDQGRGIPADKLEAIFGRFQQVDASDSRQKGGTGLGLAICRSIIGQHGGQIWAESTPGAGSTFFFTLPLPPEEL